MCNFTLVLQQRVLVQLVESPQLLEVVVVLQMLVQQQQVQEVEQQSTRRSGLLRPRGL